jgi:hypothetical protein
MREMQPLQELWEVDMALPEGERLTLEGSTPAPPGAVRSSYGSARREKAHLGGTAAPPGAVGS